MQHIMASSSPSGRVVVWDLRKSEPIIKVGDTSAMLHCKSMAWHPEVATQMVIGNEDDRYPVIQVSLLWGMFNIHVLVFLIGLFRATTGYIYFLD